MHPTRAPLLPKVRGHVAEFLNRGSLVHLEAFTPAHLCRSAVRASPGLATGLFLTARAQPHRAGCPALGASLDPRREGFASPGSLKTRTDHVHSVRWPTPPCPPFAHNDQKTVQEYRPAVHRLRLTASAKARLTLRGSPCRRKPWASGVMDSHHDRATHAGIRTCVRSRCPHDHPSRLNTTLPYPRPHPCASEPQLRSSA